MTPADIEDMLTDAEFQALPFDQRQTVAERAIGTAGQWVADNGGWTPEKWRTFGDLAQQTRTQIADSETLGEKAAWAGGVVVDTLKDAIKTAGVGVAGLSPVAAPRDAAGGGSRLEAQMPGKTLGKSFAANAAALATGVADKLLKDAEPVDTELAALRTEIDQGAFFDHPKGVQGWLDDRAQAVQAKQAKYYEDENWAQQNDLLANPDNAALLNDYLLTRSPQSWDALRSAVLRTPGQEMIRAAKQDITQNSALGRSFPGNEQYISEATDPAELAGTVFSVGAGKLAITGGRNLMQRGAALAGGVAAETAGEQVSAFMDDPNMTWEQRREIAKQSVIASLGLAGVGAGVTAAKRALTTTPENASVNDRTVPMPPADQTVPDAGTGAGSTPAAGSFVSPLPGIAQRAGTVDVAPLVPGLEAEDLGPLTAADVTDLNPAPAAAPTRQPILTNVPDARTAAQIAESQRIEEARQAKEAEMRMLDAKARGMPLIPDSPMGSRDILDWANENPIYLPPGFSEDRKLPEYESLKRNPLPNYWRQFVASAKQGGNPDSVAQRAFDAGLIPEPSADAYFAALQDGIAARKQYRVQFQARDKALAQEEKRVVDFEKSQTKLAKKPAAQEVPFDEIVPGDRMTIDGENAVVKNVEYNEDGYLTNVVIEDGKRFGLMQFDAQNRGGILVDEFKPQPRQAVEDFAPEAVTTTTLPATSAATTPAPASRATSGPGAGGQTIGETSGGALLDVAPSTRPRNRGETTAPQRADVLAELGAATREGEANQAQGRLGLGTGLNPSGMTAGFVNADIVNEALDLVVRGVRDAAAWTAAMVQRFGEAIRQYLAGLWQHVQAQVQSREVRFGGTTSRLRPSAEMGFVAAGANETQSRFASPDAAQRVINGPRADVDVAAEASAWLDSLSSEAAVDAFASRAVPLPLDAAEFAAATLISRLTMQGEQAKTEAGRLAAHVQAQRMARVWTKEYLSADPARALRQRGVANNTILRPIAPVMAAQGILVDRADAVMDKRFEGGAGGVTEKVKAILEKADIDITERVEAILSAVMGSRLQPRVTLAQAVAGLVNGKTQRQQMIDDVARALMQRAKSREVKPGTQTALAALVASLKRTLGAAVKGEALKPETLKMGELLARTFVDQVAEAPLFEEAWTAGREQVRAMLIETGLSQTQADKRLNELMPATPTVAYAPGMVKQAVQRGFEQAGYGQTLTTRMDRSGQRQVDVRAEALRNPQKAMEAVMKVWDEEADAAGISPEAWAQGRALAWKALSETMQQWQSQQQATQAKADAAAKAKLLEKDSPTLAKLLKSLKDKIAPGMSWADIFMDMPSSQRERQREIYRRLMLDERLKGLTMEQRLDLTNELDRAWQRERKAVFNRELEKAGILGEKDKGDRDKVKKALPKLLRMINLGMFNSEMWREIVAPEYGLKMLTAADTAQLRGMAEAAWKLPEGILQNKKLLDLLKSIQAKTGASWVEVLNSYWTSSILSGMRTQFDTWLAGLNGMGTNLIQIGGLIARGKGRSAIDAHAQWWRGLFEGVRESGQILFKGDTSYLKRFGADLQKALEGDASAMPVPMGEHLWRNGNTFQKYGLAPVMLFSGRLMAAADHINNTATTQGAIAVARALHPELYQGKVGFTPAERANARAQALREVTGGREPQTSEERATVSARAREILNGSLKAEDYAAASEIGDMAAYQNDPTGLFGVLYSAMKQGLGSIQRGLNDYSQDVTANRFARIVAGVMAGSLHGVTGTRFMRFGANFGADMTRYIPGSYVLGKAGFYGRDVSRMQQELLLGKNIVGLMLASTLASVFLNSDDKDEGWQIEGDWSTLNPQQVKERMAAGMERMTLWKREGDKVRRVSYKQWPTMGLFSVVGGMLDEKRHKPAQFAEHGAAGHLLRGLATGYTQVKNVSAVRNLVELFGEPTFSADAVDGTIEKMIKTGTNFAGGFVPTLIKDADIWADSRSFKPEGVAEMMMRNTPILRRFVNDGRPQLNLLGEEVKLQRAPWSRAYTNVASGEAHRVLGALLARGLSLPMPSDQVRVTQGGARVPLESLGREAVWQYERAVGQGYKDWLATDGAKLLALPVEQAEKFIQRRAEGIKRQALGRVMR